VYLENWAEGHPKRQNYIDEYNEIKKRDGDEEIKKKLHKEIKYLVYNKNTVKS
jgi:hypothetical protein